MTEAEYSRRTFLSMAAAAGLVGPTHRLSLGPPAGSPGRAPRPRPDRAPVALRTLPTRVFKTADPGHESRQSWVTLLVAESAAPLELDARKLTIDLVSRGQTVSGQRYWGKGLEPLILMKNQTGRSADGSDRLVYRPAVFWLHLSEPSALAVEAMRMRLVAGRAGDDPANSA